MQTLQITEAPTEDYSVAELWEAVAACLECIEKSNQLLEEVRPVSDGVSSRGPVESA